MTNPPHPGIVAWSVVSPFGIGRSAFADGLRAAAPPAETADGCAPGPGRVVPGLDVRALLGRERTRRMDRVSGLTMLAMRELLAGVEISDRSATAVVLGTSGTVQQMRDFTRSSLTAEKPFYVDPGIVPNGVMNCAAAQAAIWHRLTGPNTTVATGRTCGLLALAYGRRLLASGRAEQVIAGAAEEYSTTRAWLEYLYHHPAPAVALGEGCAVFLLDPHPATPPLLQLLGVDSRVHHCEDLSAVVRQCVLDLLRRHGVSPGEIWAASLSRPPGAAEQQERTAVESIVGSRALAAVPAIEPIGEATSATGAFQVAALLAADRPPAGAGRAALITSVDPGGGLSCGLFRLPDD